MPGITFNQIRSNTATVGVTYGDFSFDVTYHPALITEGLITDLSRIMLEARQAKRDLTPEDAGDVASTFTGMMARINTVLCDLIASWEVYEDDAQTEKIALTPERLARLPLDFRLAVLTSLTQGASLDPTTARPSKPASLATSARTRAATSKRPG